METLVRPDEPSATPAWAPDSGPSAGSAFARDFGLDLVADSRPARDTTPQRVHFPTFASDRRTWGRRLAVAGVASLVAHLMVTAWRGPTLHEDEPSPPLQVELTRVAPSPPPAQPPLPRVEAPKSSPPPRRPARPRPPPSTPAPPAREVAPPSLVPPAQTPIPVAPAETPLPATTAETALPEAPPPEATSEWPSAEPTGVADAPPASPTPAESPTPQEPATAGEPGAVDHVPVVATPSLTEPLPPVVELVYSAFLGSSTFIIGTVRYRFEHDGEHYGIETMGHAQGIVALLFPGELRVRSRGRVTDDGLLPEELQVQRGRADRIESARFDAMSGTLALHDKPAQPLNPPTYDLLTFWLQFYFAPPGGDEVSFRVATTRQVREYRLRRTGNETLLTPLGEVRTQVWRRVGDRDDDADAVIWLAPMWNFLPVKVRLANRRGAVEQLLVGVRTGLEVPESMQAGAKLELPIDADGRFVREEIPSERKHTP